MAMYHLRWSYTTLDGNILLTVAICYFRPLYTTFSFTWLWFCKNPRLSCDFLHLWIKMWAWIQDQFVSLNTLLLCFGFAMVSSIIFDVHFWKCCFIRNTQMLKMRNFLHLPLQMFHKANKSANNIYKLILKKQT